MSDSQVVLNERKIEQNEYAAIDVNTIGDTTIVTGVAGEKIVVYSIFLVVGGDVAVTWKTGAVTVLGSAPLKEGGGYHVETDFGITETVNGDSLVINLSGNTQTGGGITFARINV